MTIYSTSPTTISSTPTTAISSATSTTSTVQHGPRNTPEIWFSPSPPLTKTYYRSGNGSLDFMDLFSPTAHWGNVSSHVGVFMFFLGWAETNATDSQLAQAVSDINRRGIAIAVEGGALTPTSACGQGVESFTAMQEILYTLNRIRSAGGVVSYYALDEPFYFGNLYSGPNACHFSDSKIASEVDDFIQSVKTVFPDIIVGDVEPIQPGVDLTLYMNWLETFKSVTGSNFPFFHLDFDWSRVTWPTDAKTLETFSRQQGIQLGIIYDGNIDDTSDAEWLGNAEQRFVTYEAEYGGKPDQVIFESWEEHPYYTLPESQNNTFTHLILLYLRTRTALSMTTNAGPSGSLMVSGRLVDNSSRPLGGVTLNLFETVLNGPGIRGTYSFSGAVPTYANHAVVGFRVNTECGCAGNSSFSLYRIIYDEGQNRTNEVPNPDFAQALQTWGLWGNGTVSVEPSDLGAGNMLRVQVESDQIAAINSASFSVTAGANYTVSFDARVSPSSLGSGYFTVIFLSSSSESDRKNIPFAPATIQVGSATTSEDGTFDVVLQGLSTNVQLQLLAIYEGDDQYWPAYAATTLS